MWLTVSGKGRPLQTSIVLHSSGHWDLRDLPSHFSQQTSATRLHLLAIVTYSFLIPQTASHYRVDKAAQLFLAVAPQECVCTCVRVCEVFFIH